MNILLVGNIASGKGTLAESLENKLNLKHISVGDIFRSITQENTPLAETVKSYINYGQLVPDSITIELVLNRLQNPDCANGCILDGFPRTLSQAKALEGKLKLDKVLFITISKNTIVKRLTSRWSCPKCKKVYSTSWYQKDTCECGERLMQREDDLSEEAINSRIASFENNTMPVVEYYKSKNIVEILNGENTPNEVFNEALKKLEA